MATTTLGSPNTAHRSPWVYFLWAVGIVFAMGLVIFLTTGIPAKDRPAATAPGPTNPEGAGTVEGEIQNR